MSVRLPRLLDAQLREVCRLHPVTLSINERLVPPHDASMTLPPGEGAPFHAWVELYTIDGSAGFYRVSGASECYVITGDVDLEHSAAILGDAIIPGEGKYSGTCAEVLTAMLANQTTLINGRKPWVLGACAKSASIEYAYDCNNILSAMTEVVGDEKDGYALEFDDTHGFPWRVNVVSVETIASCEGRLSRNLESVSVSISDDEFCTRIYCKSLPEPHYIDGPTVGTWGIITKTITAGEGVTAESLKSYIIQYLEDHKNPRISIEINGVDLATATGESLDSFRIGRLFRLALPDYGVKMEERILVRSITDIYGDPRGVRLTLASNIRDTAEDLVRLDNTVTGGSSQNSTKKYIGGGTSKGTGISRNTLLGLLRDYDDFSSATESWKREAGVKIEANHADLYATKRAITGNWAGDVETINALITASSDNGGLVSMLVGRHNKIEDVNAAISATAAGGGLINMKADAKTVTDIGERLSSAEITLNGADGQIGLVGRVETAEGDIKSAEVKIDGLNSEIELKADSSVTDALGKRVSSAEIAIDGANSKITQVAEVTDEQGNRISAAEISIDGLNSEIELKADKITLDGYVTANQMKTEFSNFESGISDNLYVRALSASNFECSHLTVNGSGLSLVQKTVVTGVSRTKRYAKAPSGTSSIEFYECSGVSTEKMYYVSWE
nr:MAG TPA: tail protein [Caudoviricetes sp.]